MGWLPVDGLHRQLSGLFVAPYLSKKTLKHTNSASLGSLGQTPGIVMCLVQNFSCPFHAKKHKNR